MGYSNSGYTYDTCRAKCDSTIGCQSFTDNPTTGFCMTQNIVPGNTNDNNGFRCWMRQTTTTVASSSQDSPQDDGSNVGMIIGVVVGTMAGAICIGVALRLSWKYYNTQ